MSFNRLTLSVFATLFCIVTPSLASASDAAVPMAYPVWSGCGHCALRGVYPAVPVPYKTYSPDTLWAPASDYPYVPGFARPYYGHYAFHDPAYMNPRYQHVPHWRPFYDHAHFGIAPSPGPI
jgi:hypothetical protein